MSQKVLNVPLGEITMIRAICQNDKCQAVTEMPLDCLDRYFREYACPVCKEVFATKKTSPREARYNPFDDLHRALRYLNDDQTMAKVLVEFVIPLDSHTSPAPP